MTTTEPLVRAEAAPTLLTLARHFFVLGCTAFGGPPVHIGMYRELFVEQHKWLSSERFAELMAMANCLPGPSSTQLGFAIGISQGGVIGGLVSGFCFIFPSAIFMSILGFVSHHADKVEEKASPENAVALACSSVGVALVFIAIAGLIKKQVYDQSGGVVKLGAICCFTGAVCVVLHPAPAWLNPTLIFLGGAVTAMAPAKQAAGTKVASDAGKSGIPIAVGIAIFLLYLIVAAFTIWKDIHDTGFVMPFLTAGMFVWGGGPVVLPMLMTYLTPHFISEIVFLAGISFAEMMPGPVFNISCFLGIQLALKGGWPWLGGTAACWAGLMGPGIILIFGAYTLWDELRKLSVYQRALPGLNAAAVGLLVPTMFLVYDKLQERSPWKDGTRFMVVIAYYFIEMAKVNVPMVVVGAGLLGLLWAHWYDLTGMPTPLD